MRLSSELLAAGGESDGSNLNLQDLIQSENGTLSGTFESEVSEDEQSWMDSAPDQSGVGPGRSADWGSPSGGLDGGHSHSQNLALECTENLKLLVSLNRETLQAMLTTSS